MFWVSNCSPIVTDSNYITCIFTVSIHLITLKGGLHPYPGVADTLVTNVLH